MAGSQNRKAPFAQRLGFVLGRAVRRFGEFERLLVLRAGERAQLMSFGLLAFKLLLLVAATFIAIYAALWVAVIVGGLAVLSLSGRRKADQDFFDDRIVEFRGGADGFGYYAAGSKIDD